MAPIKTRLGKRPPSRLSVHKSRSLSSNAGEEPGIGFRFIPRRCIALGACLRGMIRVFRKVFSLLTLYLLMPVVEDNKKVAFGGNVGEHRTGAWRRIA